jgi:hypothetical protein
VQSTFYVLLQLFGYRKVDDDENESPLTSSSSSLEKIGCVNDYDCRIGLVVVAAAVFFFAVYYYIIIFSIGGPSEQ